MQILSTMLAAVLGGVVSPQLMQAKERRLARANVREKLATVDSLRWETEPYPEYLKAIAAFEAAAILGGVPRRVVRRCVMAADDVRRASEVFEGEAPDGGPLGVLLDKSKNEEFVRAVEELSQHLWHPMLAKFRSSR